MAVVRKYKVEVISVVRHTDDIYTLKFYPINGKFKYNPGQFLHLALDPDYDGIGQWPESRCFSMQSNPKEEYIEITYSVKGNFTKRMEQQLKIGSQIWLKLPYGDLFTRPHDKAKTVFIAGGTGITPFLSLFTHESFNEYLNPRIYIGFRSKDHNVYNDHLSKSFNPTKLVTTVYENIDGCLDIHRIFDETGLSFNYFISGPPLMIKIFKQTLIIKGVPDSKILTDDWK